ncbi:MAG: AEC family transporter [Rhodospirillales bacterium]|nr:AEC family transporter [Rhodospirillales bacterium]
MGEVIGNILPLFSLVLIGYGIGRARWMNGDQIKGLSFFVFYLAIPALLFRTLGRGEVLDVLDPSILVVYFTGTFLVMALAWALGWLVFSNRAEELPVMAMGAAYSNIVLLGIPLVYALFGEAGLLPMLMIVTVHSLILLPMTMILIEVARGAGAEAGGRANLILRPVVKAVFKNPVILSILAGIAFNLSGLELPDPADALARLLGGASAPCALVALGATLSAYRLGGDMRESLSLVALKLVVHPVLVWLLATQLFAFPPVWVAAVTITAALPIGVNVFIIADQYKVYLARTTTAVLISTVASVATVTAVVVWFGAAR